MPEINSSTGVAQTEGLTPRATIRTQHGTFEVIPWPGYNTSGIMALCDTVIVLPDQVPDSVRGIILPDQVKETTGFAATTGVLVSVGPQAFAYDSERLVKWQGQRPKAGDRIYFEKYAGQAHFGRDGVLYRLMQDRAVGALEMTEAQTEAERARAETAD